MKRDFLHQPISIHEMLPVGALLAVTGGYLDAYTYLIRGGVFANAETGNLVLFAMKLASGDMKVALRCLVQIVAFFCGVLCAEGIKRHFARRQILAWEHMVILLEMFLLFLTGFVPQTFPDVFVNLTIAFVCALQVDTFRKTAGMPYATTMCTGNLRSGAEHFYRFLFEKDRSEGRAAGRYLFIIVMFALGAVLGAVLSELLGAQSIWVCCGTLFVIFIMMLVGK